jgi:hypothetical protein
MANSSGHDFTQGDKISIAEKNCGRVATPTKQKHGLRKRSPFHLRANNRAAGAPWLRKRDH